MRNKVLDILKGIGITLVIIGHCIQYGNGTAYIANGYFFENIVFRFIYSFHMPLFVLVSGYLFYITVNKKSSKDIIKGRIGRCIIPIFLWTLIGGIIVDIQKNNEINLLYLIGNAFSNLSFLWTIVYCSLIVLLINKVYDDKPIAYFTIILLSLFINSRELDFTLYLLPYFIIGFLGNKYKEEIKKIFKKINPIIIFVVLLVLYLILFKYFNVDKYIYVTPYFIGNNINHLFIDLYRFVIGLIGSGLVIMIVNFAKSIFEKVRIFEILGKNSMAIYIISCYLNLLLLNDSFTANYTFSYLNVLIETILILIISNVFAFLLRKNKYTKKYLIGE